MTRLAALALVAVGVLALGARELPTNVPSPGGDRTEVVVTLTTRALGIDPAEHALLALTGAIASSRTASQSTCLARRCRGCVRCPA